MNKKGLVIAAAAAALFMAGCAHDSDYNGDKGAKDGHSMNGCKGAHKCKRTEKNKCKGRSECKGDNSCSGENSCS